VIGIDRCGLVGDDGETHQGVFDTDFPFFNHILCFCTARYRFK
jgi:deoxyxylulose-5-phosphate synthase